MERWCAGLGRGRDNNPVRREVRRGISTGTIALVGQHSSLHSQGISKVL